MTDHENHDAVLTNEDLSPSVAFLAEANVLWPDVDGFYRFVHEGMEIGAFCLDDIHEDQEVSVSLIKVRRPMLGLGHGTRMLEALCALADKHEIALRMEVVPTGPLNEVNLTDWYSRRGFIPAEASYMDEGPVMSRSPQAQPEKAFTPEP
jgi:N-acetylglutamate synthase-like GNAT family acetyltransferase